MKLGLLGYGVVGAGVYEMCTTQGQIEVAAVLCRHPEKVPDQKGVATAEAMLADESVDVIVEVLGGLHPAYELVSAALRAKKHVVTANKYLVCKYYRELTSLAAENGVALRCTAAVGGGIPWLVNLQRACRQDTVQRVGGILNGTSNYILDAMHRAPVGFAETLASAQRLGYAEADPAADIDGWDIRRKLAISANIAFGCAVAEEDVLTVGIRRVTAEDIADCKAHGYTCKLLADAALLADGNLYAIVEPCLLGPDWPEANVPTNYNLISMWGEAIGKESFFGQGAGRQPTAYNVMQDLADIAAGARGFYTERCQPRRVDNAALTRRYYVRTAAQNSWLAAHTESRWPSGAFVTKPVPPAQMHAAAHTMEQADETTFFAALE